MPALSVTVQIQLDASGNGTASIGPLSSREVWHPASVHVSVSTNTNEAAANIYVGDAPQQRCYRDTTFSGSSGDSSDRVAADTVKNPHRIWAVWTGGDAKAFASLTVTGTLDV